MPTAAPLSPDHHRTLGLDPDRAEVAARALDDLAEDLRGAARTQHGRTAVVTSDWKGPSRRWFDRHDAEVAGELRSGARAAASAATAIRAEVRAAVERQLPVVPWTGWHLP
ncbi:hypothetical protein KSP35_00765 [Aquihabitans sp. G128]|uniref:PPE domain-containing protein n=1 Tax=Aquihabitans sp. G128 TaxID=2849779 RepID=UPI001C21BA27|nr:hypothetical protein [Aquihabitans sp. G128]QXC61419.1 hypothetical protein KSP35_00765 [Aquihabitans sp. G128]